VGQTVSKYRGGNFSGQKSVRLTRYEAADSIAASAELPLMLYDYGVRVFTFGIVMVVALLTLGTQSQAAAAEKLNAVQLIELAKSPGPALRNAIVATFDPKDLQEGTS